MGLCLVGVKASGTPRTITQMEPVSPGRTARLFSRLSLKKKKSSAVSAAAFDWPTAGPMSSSEGQRDRPAPEGPGSLAQEALGGKRSAMCKQAAF